MEAKDKIIIIISAVAVIGAFFDTRIGVLIGAFLFWFILFYILVKTLKIFIKPNFFNISPLIDISPVSAFFNRIKKSRFIFKTLSVFFMLIIFASVGFASLYYYYNYFKPNHLRKIIMTEVLYALNNKNIVSGDMMIMGYKYNSSIEDIEKKEGVELKPCEEADTEKAIMAYSTSNNRIFYFDDSGKLIAGKSKDFSAAELKNGIIKAWGKSKPIKYSDYEIYIKVRRGLLFLIVLRKDYFNGIILVVEPGKAEFLLSYLFAKNLLLNTW